VTGSKANGIIAISIQVFSHQLGSTSHISAWLIAFLIGL
jgi:hypothetical protein